jgi:uncharacterized protein involved in exopolysaccharide biosynthesis
MRSESPTGTNIWVAESSLTLGDLVRAMRRRWWWLLGSIAVTWIGFALWAFLVPPTYRATVVVVPAGVEKGLGGAGAMLGQLGGLASLAGLNLASGDSLTEEALAVLQSREFGERFISDHDLLPRFFPHKWDGDRNQVGIVADGRPTLAEGFRHFDENVRRVSRDKKSGLIMVSVDWTDREEAAAWANDLVGRINADMRTRAIESATASLAFLESERERTAFVETRQTINRLIEAQVSQRMIASVTPEYVFRVVDRALPPDAKDPVSPTRTFLLIAGPIVGLMLGAALALLHAGLAREFPGPGTRDRREVSRG